MRLTTHQVDLIRSHISHSMGANSRIWLFGSRVDPARKGGDVDLYVEPEQPVPLRQELQCRGELADALDLPVDLIVARPDQDRPIYRIARSSGRPL